MTALRLSELEPSRHVGVRVRATYPDGRVREGRLGFAQNPTYRRIEARHWWLYVPTARPDVFGPDAEDAVSLQWASATSFEILEPSA